MKLKAKFGKHLSDKEFLKLILKEREKREFPKVKNMARNEVSAVTKQSGVIRDYQSVTGDTFSETRYIHANKKREVIAQTNGKCAYPNCNSPFEVIHHIYRYSESKNHDFVVPLCKIHHEFSHNNLIQNETLKTDEWRISVMKPPSTKISQADVLYRKYRLLH